MDAVDIFDPVQRHRHTTTEEEDIEDSSTMGPGETPAPSAATSTISLNLENHSNNSGDEDESEYPWSVHSWGGWPSSSTLATVPVYSEHAQSGSITSMSMPTSSSTNNAAVGGSKSADDPNSSGASADHNGIGPAKLVPAVMLPIAVVVFVGAIAFICLRRRKKRMLHKQVTATTESRFYPKDDPRGAYKATPQPQLQQPEMVGVTTHGVYRSPETQMSTPPIQPPPRSLSPPAAPPVVLTSMAPAMGAAYFTGIDTSDVVSIRSSDHDHAPANGFTFDPEEAPPPYRPRSVPPISRGNSVRQPFGARDAHNHLLGSQGASRAGARSPFADPDDDDDHLSIISGIGERLDRHHHEDRMSDVSDISYQEPIAVRQAV